MHNKLPQNHTVHNIFSKLLGIIRNLFGREKNEVRSVKTLITAEEQEKNGDATSNFTGRIKVNTNNKNSEYEKRVFMENLKKNPDLLENFTNDRLEQILKYYQDENAKKRELLKKLNT